ncbi:hypothetical protein N7467_007678, partial [Penicillium canescens]
MLDLYIDPRPRGFLNGADESTLRKGVFPPSEQPTYSAFGSSLRFRFAKWFSRSFLVTRYNLNDMDIPAVVEIGKKEAMIRKKRVAIMHSGSLE